MNEVSEETNKRGKSIALKSTHRRSSSSKAMKASKESDEEDKEPSNDYEKDEIAHLAERILRLRSVGRKRKDLFPKRTKRERPNKVKSFALNARSLDT